MGAQGSGPVQAPLSDTRSIWAYLACAVHPSDYFDRDKDSAWTRMHLNVVVDYRCDYYHVVSEV
ncbi:hypothetical protein BN1708_011362 [Verticillium longisporum]|uniref:Uncharacterized protein n=1 Tax=Verticillium longisporum TaxID=100787 RepID=A0A0G4KZE4_VERLO|nr:hypothetical protein BN1708_011362 [Verticillium longisporum]